jgi:quercetin dioxygenase-like cupin family protein
MNPYQHEGTIRTFSKDVDEWDLIWHKDKQDRHITVLEGEGWKFQRDNSLPLDLKKGDRIFIPKEQIHRVLKGKTDLVIEIIEK